MLNLFLCLDLIKTIQSPFTPPGSRTKLYYVVSFFVPVVMILIVLGINSAKNKNVDGEGCLECIRLYYNTTVSGTAEYSGSAYTDPSANVGTMITGFGNYVLSFVMSCYILSAIYSVIYALRRLNRRGVSQEIRSMFLKKH